MNLEKELFDQFIRRVAYGTNIKKVDSLGVHSGTPHYSYCEHCGVPTEAFPEKPLFPSFSCCSQCSILEKEKILERAKEISKKFFCLT